MAISSEIASVFPAPDSVAGDLVAVVFVIIVFGLLYWMVKWLDRV